eukprot:12508147-Alexandrium_andersonii.AAC.1
MATRVQTNLFDAMRTAAANERSAQSSSPGSALHGLSSLLRRSGRPRRTAAPVARERHPGPGSAARMGPRMSQWGRSHR